MPKGYSMEIRSLRAASFHSDANVVAVESRHRLPAFRLLLNRTGSGRIYSSSGRIYSHVAAWIALAHLLAVPSRSTSVIAVLFDDAVVVVADSKMVDLSNGKASSVCKIHSGKKFAWVVSGLVADTAGYDVNRIIRRIAVKEETVRNKVTELDEAMPDVIRAEAKKLRTKAPKVFERYINSSEILEFLYIGADGGKMMTFFREYKIELIKGQVNVDWTWSRDCPGKGCRRPQMTVMGERVAVEKYIVAHPAALAPSSIEAAMQTGTMFVQMEAAASPEVVAFPVNTAVIDTQAVRWGADNKQCKEMNRERKPNAENPAKHP